MAGVPVLNFGASGNFGPLQELLIYEEFKYLPHQGLIIYVLPDNDFTDNDLEVWRNKNQLVIALISANRRSFDPILFPCSSTKK